MTQILGAEKQGLTFEIVSARICDDADVKNHVIYTLRIRYISGNDDLSPSLIERRYTHFLNLYNALKLEQPTLMANVPFPKKVFLGNFDNELISNRSTAFESLLSFISTQSKLRTSNALRVFLQEVELAKAKLFLEKKEFFYAMPLLESIFKLLNKVFTDRSPAVLIALCRLLACSVLVPNSGSNKWADLALHRYEGVSDSDLLELYVPLLQICIKVYWQNDRNNDFLEKRLRDLKRTGVKVHDKYSMLDTVTAVEETVFKK